MEEIQQTVFRLNEYSAAGPDGFNGKLYRHCWDIIRYDLFDVIMKYFPALRCHGVGRVRSLS